MAYISCPRVHIKIARETKCANKLQICPSLTLISILALFDITLGIRKGVFQIKNGQKWELPNGLGNIGFRPTNNECSF